MSIGHWIVVSFVLFAAFIGTLVAVCLREDISLVTKDYYQEELAYQDQIQRLNNVAELKEKPVIRVVDRVDSSGIQTIQYNDERRTEYFLSLECTNGPQIYLKVISRLSSILST